MADLYTREELEKRIEAQKRTLALMPSGARVCLKCDTIYTPKMLGTRPDTCFCDYESDRYGDDC